MKLIFVAVLIASATGRTLDRPVQPLFSPSERVINGEDAKAGDWPWQASLQRSGSHFCGGSLIAAGFVVTAAHCEITSTEVKVGLGGVDTDQLEQYITQETFTVHPEYNPSTYDYDYGIVALQSDATLDNLVNVANLVKENQEYPAGTPATLTGWGYIQKNGQQNGVSPDVLQQGVVPLMSKSQCQSIWTSVVITDRMQCAGGADVASCNGDSGGPLVVQDGSDYVLIGAVSWGSSRCYTNYPSAYAKLSAVRPWIQSIAGV